MMGEEGQEKSDEGMVITSKVRTAIIPTLPPLTLSNTNTIVILTYLLIFLI